MSFRDTENIGGAALSGWRREAMRYLPALRRTALLALACNLALELFRLTGVAAHPWKYKSPWFPVMFLVGTVVVWMLVGLVHAVVGRWWLTRVVMVALTLLVAFVDYEKVRLRREPLYPGDLAFVTDLDLIWTMVGVRSAVLTGIGAVVLAVVLVLSRRSEMRKGPAPQPPGSRGSRVALRVATALLCLAGLVHVANFNEPGNVARAVYESLGAKWRPWSQQRNYLGNGFVAGVLYNTDVPVMTRPPGYGPEAMAQLVARYTAEADRINSTRQRDSLDDVNVVMVLSETFSDPTALRGLELPGDPIPFTRALMQRTTSGQMLANGIGGGTANMEFEAVTGMSLALFPAQLRVPYQMLIPGKPSFPSTVQWFERTGHRTVAVHPYGMEMYRRRDVYRAFGFDEFVHEEVMRARQRLGHDGYISDAAAFREVQRTLRESAEPAFVHLVTMQNHIPYGDRYPDPVHVTEQDGTPIPEIGHYVRGLSHSDAALRDFIASLESLSEPTAVVFFGDHLPGTYPDSVHRANPRPGMRKTPFFVWSNFAGEQMTQPLTSPRHFVDLLIEHTDSPVTPYLALLTALRAEVPAMDGTTMYDVQGRPLTPEDLTPRAAQLLNDYRLVQYDLAVGRRYVEAPMLEGRTTGTDTAVARGR